MKNSTFSAQVANNLLTLLQGYSKTIRLLLVMFLTLTVSANAWGADYELVTSAPSDWSGEYLIVAGTSALSGGTSSWGTTTAVTVTNDKISTTANISVTISKGGTSGTYYIYMNSNSKYLKEVTSNTFATADASSTDTEWKITLSNGNAQIACASTTTRYLRLNGTSGYRCYTSATGTLPKLYKKSASYTITAKSNNNTYGTVSLSGTIITATPKTGYRVSTTTPYTISPSGSATVTQSENKFTVTPSANTTITINFEALPKYTVTLDAGPGTCAASVTEASAGAGVELPTPTLNGCGEWTFAGWKTTSAVTTETSTKPTLIPAGNYKPTANTTLFAVYQRTETTEGTPTTTNETYTHTIGAKTWSANGAQTLNSISWTLANNGSYYGYDGTKGQQVGSSGSPATSITLTTSGFASATKITAVRISTSGASSISGNVSVKVGSTAYTSGGSTTKSLTSTNTEYEFTGSSTGNITISWSQTSSKAIYFKTIEVDYQTTTAGGGSTTYYHSTPDCAAGDPCDALQAPNVKATATANSITLSWAAVDGATSYNIYNYTTEDLDETTSLTYTFTGLSSETEYEWGVESAKDECFKETRGTTKTLAEAPKTYTITFEANGGTKIDKIENATTLPTSLPTTTRDHYTFVGWYMDETFQTQATAGATINADITLYAKWTPITYTVTFDAGSGTCATEPTQGNFETGLELPTATPCSYASTNGWSFVGWSESTVSETTVRPAIHTGNYKPTKDIKLHAVYAKTGTAQGAEGEFILSLEYEGTTYYVGQTFDNSKLSAETNQANAARFTIEDNYLHYEGGYISHVATQSSTNITRQTDKANAKAWTITEEANTIIFTSTADNTRGLGFNYNTGSPRFAAYQLSNADYPHTFTKTSVSGGNVQVTTYNSKPSCEAPVDPTWGDVQITHTAIKANCGSTTVLGSEGENGPATISFGGTDLQNSVTVTASDGFLVSTDKKAPEKYAKSVIIYPNSTGNNIGQITQNVHVIADATAKNESYTGTITLTGNDIPGGSQVINVTAAVTCTQYTITWSVNGDNSHQETYSPGDALQLPEIDITPCDGMAHVGWTDNMGYVHGTNILFTETTDMTVTGNQTYYAVFATPTSSGGGETTTTLDFSQQGYANEEKVTSVEKEGITVSFSQGGASNPPAYYNTGTAIRVYAKGSFTVSSTNTISQIKITFGTGDGTNEISTNVSDYSEGTWNGSANEIIFTVGGESKHRRIKSITVTSAGGGASYYTGHTTTCSGSQQLATPTNLQATDITYNGATLTWDAVAGANKYKVVINGTEYISNTNSYTTHTLNQQTAYTWIVQAIGNGTTFTDSEISAEATFTTGTALVITWSVSTVTTTTTITKGQPIGANLKTPATPAACEGKYFMGWSASSTVNSDGSDFTPITSATVPETNVTYYAVFAEPTGNSGAQGELFSESFETIEGSGGNDGKWDGNIASAQLTEHGNWVFTYAYKGNECIKLGKASGQGEATTPALGISGNATLTFAAGAWNGSNEQLTINLQIVGEGSIEPSSVTLTKGQFTTYTANITGANADTKVKFSAVTASNNRFFLDEVKVSGGTGNTSYTDYSTSCGTYTVTFYGFNNGEYTTICNDNPAEIAVAQGETYQIPNCEPTDDPAGLGRTFAGTWNTQANGKGTAYEPGDEFIVNSDITLYAQWALNTSGNTTLPTDVEDLATTDVVVTGGTTLTLQAGTTTINSLTLKGGLLVEDDIVSGYAMPSVVIPDNATLVRKNTTINLDLVVNNDSWYPFAVPFALDKNDNIDYLDPVLKAASTYNTHFAIKTYDGENRAKVGTDQENNWDKVPQTAGLQPGKGYIISALTYPDKDTATIRIPMNVDNAWLADGEQESIIVKETTTTRNAVAVAAHTGAAATEHQRHAGWNFVANPYLSKFAGSNVANDVTYIKGSINIQDKYTYEDTEVTYVTVPAYNFAYYEQFKLSTTKLNPEYSFFVQVGTDGTMTFETAGRQQAPASIAAHNAEERPVKMDVDITLSDNHSSDLTGIIISDRYSDAYEIGSDLEKLFGSAYNLSVYTLMADNTPLAFQALAIRSNMQVIPVGYRAPEQGEYTFHLNETTSSIDLLNEQYEQLVLVDYETGELTNLLVSDYTFYSERTQADNRFALYAVPRQNAPTDLPNALGQDKEAQKIIHNGHLYILRDGNVYNGNGQMVK